MRDTELFMELAGIAGVFVGFGALIALRSGGASEPQEVSPVRVTVAMGVMTIIGALAPVTLGRYDLTAHQVLALSSVLVLCGTIGISFMHIRSPEYKAYAASWGTLKPSYAVGIVAWLLLAADWRSPRSSSSWAWPRTWRRRSTSRSSCSSCSWPPGLSCHSSSRSDAPKRRPTRQGCPDRGGSCDGAARL